MSWKSRARSRLYIGPIAAVRQPQYTPHFNIAMHLIGYDFWKLVEGLLYTDSKGDCRSMILPRADVFQP